MEKILEMFNITKHFGTVYALKDVSISLEKGEILAIVGENGAGKSTLMKILSGHYPSGTFEGEIVIKGQKKIFKNSKSSKDAGIEMIYQEISLHLDLTAGENIFLGNLPDTAKYLVDWSSLFDRSKKYLDLVGLDISPREIVRNLNTSQQQLLSIAKALSGNPEILVLDEPTSALTEIDARNLLNIIKSLKGKGISSIYISHRLEEVFEIADRVAVLRDGCLISAYENKEISAERIIEDMVGRKIESMFPKVQVKVGEEILRVEELTVPHPYTLDRNIVENISFNLRRGEILGIAGLVGSGRSELVNAIFGSIKKTSGKIFIKNKEVNIMKPYDAILQGIGLVTEDRKRSGLVGTMDLKANMTLASLGKISRKGIINRGLENKTAESFFRNLRVKARGLDDNIMSLSGGNQQKVVLTKWLMRDIEILILDEPTRGIDVGAKVEIYNIMTELAGRGIGIIMISSELPELMAMCDRFIILAKGRIFGQMTRDEVSQSKIMKAATGLEDR